MLAYHGTSLQWWEEIRKTGLLPRKNHRKSNWKNTIESNPDTVYLTDAYALCFGLSAIKDTKGEQVVIIEVDTDTLSPLLLVADEDALEQASREQNDGLPAEWSMARRTRYYRSMVGKYAKAGYGFNWSMKAMGTGGYLGSINPSSFTRVAIIDPDKEHALCSEYLNCSVCIMGYTVLGSKYRGLNQMVFGNPVPEIDSIAHLFCTLPTVGAGVQILNL